jgi:hypothetical protein
MGAPPAAFVNDYFDVFNANAVHLWQNGLPTEMDGWAAANNPAFRWVSWVLPDGTSMDGHQVAGGYPPNSPGRIGYQICDEPRTWEELYSYEEGFAALRAHDPDGLLILNFTFQAEEIDAFLDYFCAQMDGDVIAYDRYSRSSHVYETMLLFRNKALGCDKPYWRYLNAYMDENLEEEHHESDQRWDAFAGMLFGYTGHTWFLYQVNDNPILNPVVFENKNSFTSPKTAKYAMIAQINVEMANLGRAVTQLTSTDVRYVPTLDIYLPPEMTRWAPGAGGDVYITDIDMAPNQFFLEVLVGHFEDDFGEQYVMVQNVRHEHGSFPIDRSDAGTIRISFDFSSAPAGFDNTAVLSLNKLTGQVESVPLTSTTGDTGYLDVLLEAGDPFLFKYNNGAPFALGP